MKMKMLLQFLVVLSLGEFGRGQTFPSCVDISSTAGYVCSESAAVVITSVKQLISIYTSLYYKV